LSLPGDGHAEYFSPWLAEKPDEADALAEMLERLPAVGADLLRASGDFTVPKSLLSRVECCQLIVREDAISFIAIPKHTDSYVHPAEIPLHLIEAAALA
jgi:hypothetical protein